MLKEKFIMPGESSDYITLCTIKSQKVSYIMLFQLQVELAG